MFIFIFFVTALSLIINGYYFNIIDHAFYLTYLNKIENPSLYFGDYFFSQSHSGYSLFNNFTVFIKKLLSIDYSWIYLFFFLLTLFLSYLAIFSITQKLSRNRYAPYLATIFFLAPKWVGGIGNFTHAKFFMSRDLALSLGLWAIFFLLQRSFIAGVLLIILCFTINPTLTPPLIIFAFYLIFSRIKISKMIFLFFILILTISFFFILKNNIFDAEWFNIMKQRGTYSFPLLWKYTAWGNLFLYYFILLSSYFWDKKIFGKYQKSLFLFLSFSTIIFILHTIFTSLAPLPWLVQFQFLRSITYISVFSLISLALLLGKIIERKNVIFISLATMAGITVYLWNDHLTFWHFLILSLFFLANFILLKEKSNKQISKFKINWPFYLIIFLIFHSFLILTIKKPLIKIPYYIATPSFYTKFDEKRYWDWIQTQLWAKNNTLKDDIFLTPYYLDGFRVYSQRTIVGEGKDGGVIFYNPYYAKEWKRRMTDSSRYFNNKLENILYLTGKYKADYLVVEKEKFNLPFLRVFENSSYKIYKLQSSQF